MDIVGQSIVELPLESVVVARRSVRRAQGMLHNGRSVGGSLNRVQGYCRSLLSMGRYRGEWLVSRIREVLLNDWDPVNISLNPNLADEYDSYIVPLIRLAESEQALSAQKVASFLERCEKDEMGLTLERHNRDRAAEKLIEILGLEAQAD